MFRTWLFVQPVASDRTSNVEAEITK